LREGEEKNPWSRKKKWGHSECSRQRGGGRDQSCEWKGGEEGKVRFAVEEWVRTEGWVGKSK